MTNRPIPRRGQKLAADGLTETKTRRLQLVIRPSVYEELAAYVDELKKQGMKISVNDAVDRLLEEGIRLRLLGGGYPVFVEDKRPAGADEEARAQDAEEVDRMTRLEDI